MISPDNHEGREKKCDEGKTDPETPRPPDPGEGDSVSSIFYLHTLLLLCGRFLGRILVFYNNLFSLSPKDKICIYSNISTHYVNKGLYDRALTYLHRWAKAEPENPDVHYRLGVVQLARENSRQALQAFRRVLEARPHHKGALFRTCSILLRQKRHEEVASTLSAVKSHFSGHARFHYYLGLSLEGMGQTEQAAEAMKRATELDPEEIKYHQHLGFLHVQLDDHKTAARSFTRVMEIERDSEAFDEEI